MEETSTLTQQDASNELLPPKDHADVGRKVFQLLEKVLQYKADQGLPGKWHRCYELAKGKHWKKDTSKTPLPTANLLYAHRSRTVAMLTDNAPTFNTKPTGEVPVEKELDIAMVQHTTSHWWRETEQQDSFETSVINGETNGVVIEKIRFDPDEEYGIGEVVTEPVDPYHFGWYPVTHQNPAKAHANLHYRPMNVRDARRRWPDMAGKILPDSEWIELIGDAREQVTTALSKTKDGFWSKLGGRVLNMLNTAEDPSGKEENVLVVECWFRDYTRVTNEDGSTQDMYPGNIRTVWTCNGGEVVLEDSPNRSINWDVLTPELARNTYLFDKYPFNVTWSIKDTASPWGMTDMEQLESLNVEFNKTVAQMTMMKDKSSRINIINPKNSGVANSKFTNAYGIINPKNHMVADAIRYMDQPKIPPELTSILQIYRELFFLVSGAFDMEQADAPGNNAIAYKAIAALLERVATLLRSKLRNYHRLIRTRGRMYISCAQNWYIDTRWISYESDGDEEVSAVDSKTLLQLPGKLSVVSGSTMPVSKIQQREEALELHKMGVIDNEELLKKLEWDDRKSVIARMKRGPIGIAMSRLVELGLPQPIADYFLEIGIMDDKDFERAFTKMELPDVPTVMAQVTDETGVASEPQTNPVEDSEIQVHEAEIEKIKAETELIRAKIKTEEVEQFVKTKGTDFDSEKLKIERARTVSDIIAKRSQGERDDVRAATDLVRGEKDEQRADAGEDRADKAEGREDQRLATETQTAEAEQKVQGPYREKGMKSNNKEK